MMYVCVLLAGEGYRLRGSVQFLRQLVDVRVACHMYHHETISDMPAGLQLTCTTKTCI